MVLLLRCVQVSEAEARVQAEMAKERQHFELELAEAQRRQKDHTVGTRAPAHTERCYG
jgi:hypothetical protein